MFSFVTENSEGDLARQVDFLSSDSLIINVSGTEVGILHGKLEKSYNNITQTAVSVSWHSSNNSKVDMCLVSHPVLKQHML